MPVLGWHYKAPIYWHPLKGQKKWLFHLTRKTYYFAQKGTFELQALLGVGQNAHFSGQSAHFLGHMSQILGQIHRIFFIKLLATALVGDKLKQLSTPLSNVSMRVRGLFDTSITKLAAVIEVNIG
jgi:hypothetical protein